MLDERKENRRLRLIQLMAERFAGKQALLSDHVGVSPNLVSRGQRHRRGHARQGKNQAAEEGGFFSPRGKMLPIGIDCVITSR